MHISINRLQAARACAFLLLALASALSHAAAGHVHGVATLAVALDGERLTLEFASPLENLVGFERAPRNDKEKEAVRRMKETLQQPERVFVPTAAAGCARESVTISAPVLEGGKPDKGGHAALSAEIVFRCARPQALSGLETKAFEAFRGLTRLDVQVAANRQTAARLSPKNPRVTW